MLIGIDKQLQMIEEWLDSFELGSPLKRACLLYGKPGMGKTSSVYYIAEKRGYKVCEYNMSEERDVSKLEKLYNQIRLKTFVKTIFLLDEIDGFRATKPALEMLYKILTENKNPLMLTCNEIRVLAKWKVKVKKKDKEEKVSLLDLCMKVSYNNVSRAALLQAARQHGVKVNKVPSSFRKAISMKYSDVDKELNFFDKLKVYFSTGNIDGLDKDNLLLILENVIYEDMSDNPIEFIRACVMAHRLKSLIPIKGFTFSNVRNINYRTVLSQKFIQTRH